MVRHLRHARQFIHQARQTAHIFHLLQLVTHIVQIKLFTLGDFLGKFLGFLLINLRLHLFDQAEHIAHVQNTAGGTIWVKNIQTIQFFADTDKLDWLSGNVADRQGCTTTRITIGLGQYDASQWQCIGKGFCSVGGILPGHRIDNKQGFDRRNCSMQGLDFLHHRFVDRQTTGGVDNQNINITFASVINGGTGNIDRILIGIRCKK